MHQRIKAVFVVVASTAIGVTAGITGMYLLILRPIVQTAAHTLYNERIQEARIAATTLPATPILPNWHRLSQSPGYLTARTGNFGHIDSLPSLKKKFLEHQNRYTFKFFEHNHQRF